MPCLFQFSSVPPWLCGEFPRVLSIHNLLQICVNSRNSRQSFLLSPLTEINSATAPRPFRPFRPFCPCVNPRPGLATATNQPTRRRAILPDFSFRGKLSRLRSVHSA
jgi:hypothetical protein